MYTQLPRFILSYGHSDGYRDPIPDKTTRFDYFPHLRALYQTSKSQLVREQKAIARKIWIGRTSAVGVALSDLFGCLC
jgi:hypothetical protein